MKRGTLGLLIGLGVVFLLGFGSMSSYNRLVDLRESVDKAWADVESVLQRRLDLIPNLVNTVKGYAEHEKEVLTAVTNARAKVGSAQSVSEKIDANRQLTSALGRLLVVMENYPQLKANQNFLALQSQLEGTENRIAVARRRYNEAVRGYRRAIKRVPGRFVAALFGFEERPFYEADEAAHTAPTVEF